MTNPKVLGLSENVGTMTFADGLEFIARTRRQLDRFSSLPHVGPQTIAPDDADEIRRFCNELEIEINRSLTGI